jgi:hypothetical protein
MKIILLKLLLFAMIIASMVTGLILSSDYMINKRKDYFLKTRPDTFFVFAGNSTVECAVDDRLIGHSVNIAQAGEAYLYSYAKIKALLENNDNIRTVFISYSYADLLIEKEETWLLSDYFMVEKVQHYNYILETPERCFLVENNPYAYFKGVVKSIVKSYETVLKSFGTTGNTNSIPNYGGYKHLERDKLEVDPGIVPEEEEIVLQSVHQIKYLRIISELCHQRSVNLVLLNPPKYKSYNENVSPGIKHLWLEVHQSLSTDSLLDLSGFLMPDSCYGDQSHVNFRGARLFSIHMNEILNSESEGNSESALGN